MIKGNIKKGFVLGFLMTVAFVMILGLLLTFPRFARAEKSLCAEVKIEIKQELTLERQAFDAHMRITNGVSHITLEDVDIDVSFTDEEGVSVLASSDPNNTDALFYIRVDSMENITGITGSGTVAPSSTADIHWLIIPAPGASNGLEQGTLYYIGATLTYTIGGEQHVTEVNPDYIFVKPMPELTLDYFLPIDVYGDDAFTTEIEPPIPFYLGVRVKNNGDGIARDLKIESAQPKIVENKQGLLIGFVIEGCEVNGQPATESLLVDFGDIGPTQSAAARWIMTCTLSGQFVEFEADYYHSDELGGELTSLMESVNTHFLVRDVRVDVAGRDGIRDFLGKDDDVYRVFESDSGAADTVVQDVSSSSNLTGSGEIYTLATPINAGFMYVKVPDPHNGQKEISKVFRSDGKFIKAENAWLSKTRNEDMEWEYFINLFDANTTGSYTVTFGEPPVLANPPVLQFIPDRSVVETNQISFLVEATDADGTYPALSVSPLPAQASFTDQGDGTGVFDWTPAEGQAGKYEMTFKASDGALEDSQRATLMVCSVDDTDCDGMDDSWEMDHFGTLDRDGTGDFDGDGVSDLDEFLAGTDPTYANNGPGPPGIHAPQIGEELTILQPQLTVQNSLDPDGDTLSYVFELYADEQMNTLVTDAFDVPEGSETTSWSVPMELTDNSTYFWRARAYDGSLYSLWAYGQFFVNTQNDAPGMIQISIPQQGDEVDTTTPTLEVTNSADVDEDTLTYAFEVYDDESMTTLMASVSGIAAGEMGRTSWNVSPPLTDDAWYFWKTIVTDEHGAQNESPLSSFFVSGVNHAPQSPVILSPGVGSEEVVQTLDLMVNNATDTDGDSLSYIFELDLVQTFDSPDKQSSGEISEGATTTVWSISNLEDNTLYYWRVRAYDGAASCPWVLGEFFVNTADDAPSVPTLRNPGIGSWVGTFTPGLEVHSSKDADCDALNYGFEVYTDPSLSALMAEGESGVGQWTLPVSLNNNTWYYWRARSMDEHGLASPWSPGSAFLVLDDGVDDPPSITILESAQDILTNEVSVLIRWDDSDLDSNADIALYYDTDSSGEDGTLFASDLQEDPDGSADTYPWNITAVPDGTYYVYAVISDDTSVVVSYAASSITIDRTPPVVQITPGGGTYNSAQSVTLSADEPAALYYTLDGTDPSTDSMPYTDPIGISEDTTLKAMAVDEAGNQSNIFTAAYVFQQDLMVTVETGKGRRLSGIRVYAFTESGSYIGRYATTDENGIGTFTPEDFADATYKFRIDYLGNQFWSDVITMPGTSLVDVIIDEESVEVTVSTGYGTPQGVRVYLFSESGAYLGFYQNTDASGMVSFELPVGRGFKFRADILGSQYWSAMTTVAAGGVNSTAVDAGGGVFEVTVDKAPASPMQGIKVYLFKSTGSYLGLYAVTDAAGMVSFDVPQGTYKVRADYLGCQFWSTEATIIADSNLELSIPHQPVEITVQGSFQGMLTPFEGINVYLFTSAGSYLDKKLLTDVDGKVSFDLPDKPYKVRADYLSRQYWSQEIIWQDQTLSITMADVELTVTGGGFPQQGVNVYVFTLSGSYLGLNQTTDIDGKVFFSLPENTYKFRVDYLGSQYWSAEETLTADMVNPILVSVGGGTFTLTVLKEATDPLVGAACYAFTDAGSYLGLSGATDSNGDVLFDLGDGAYMFRVDYMGYQFWSDVVTIPSAAFVEMMIEEEIVEITVNTGSGPAQGVRVYLFSESGVYLGQYEETDAAGVVSFGLPVGKNYQFRADILGNQYWSSGITVTVGGVNNLLLDAGGGLFEVTVEKAPGSHMQGITAYLFNASDTYLGLSQVSDASGVVGFEVPEGTYKVRADYLGYQFWSAETAVTGDSSIALEIPHLSMEITVQGEFQGIPEPFEGIKVYLFTSAGFYLGQYAQTNADGKVVFDLPEKAYKVRADYLTRQYWSQEIIWQDTTVSIPMADAEVTVTGAGFPTQGVTMYVFRASGSYLGISGATDADGMAVFRLPEGYYKFRLDYQSNQYWSADETLTADQTNPILISVGGGTFAFTVLKGAADPLFGVSTYAFTQSGSYLGMYGATNSDGDVFFDLADGTYKFRVDHLGYQFWSNVFDVPTAFSGELLLPHTDVVITVEGLYQTAEPLEGLRIYLFSPSEAYLGKYQDTDTSGQVSFTLPDQPYKVRIDYLGNQFWSDVFQFQNTTVTINQGLADIHVHRSGADVEGARVYLFSETGAYLSWHEDTDDYGNARFILPDVPFKFRVDEGGGQYWSPVLTITAGQVSSVDMDLDM